MLSTIAAPAKRKMREAGGAAVYNRGGTTGPVGGNDMKRVVASALAALLLVAPGLRADDRDDLVPGQRKAARDNWARAEGGPEAVHETAHLILVAPPAMQNRLKDIGNLLEKFYDTAAKPLFMKEPAWEGKLAVYLFAKPEQLDSFIRLVEGRRVRRVERGTFSAADDRLHAAACPPREKGDPAIEVQAGQQVASAVLMRKAGARTPVPYWLTAGFGRATYYRTTPAAGDVGGERRAAARFAARYGRTAAHVWGGSLEGDEAAVLAASLADYLAYGPGKAKFAAVLEGFKPGENGLERTAGEALEAAGLRADAVTVGWRRWIGSPR
jgi:hypothetical protein